LLSDQQHKDILGSIRDQKKITGKSTLTTSECRHIALTHNVSASAVRYGVKNGWKCQIRFPVKAQSRETNRIVSEFKNTVATKEKEVEGDVSLFKRNLENNLEDARGSAMSAAERFGEFLDELTTRAKSQQKLQTLIESLYLSLISEGYVNNLKPRETMKAFSTLTALMHENAQRLQDIRPAKSVLEIEECDAENAQEEYEKAVRGA
jgi:hypothetical protein